MILMILLASIAVGLMALASSQSRLASSSILSIQARQQALFGLDAALGELQVELGPDQRISANSGLLNEDEKHTYGEYLLGVWDSWDGPIYGDSYEERASSIKDTYDKGRSVMFRRWLISSRDRPATRQMDAYKHLSIRKPGDRICLVGEGSLGELAPYNQYIYADLIQTPLANYNAGYFAWWVGGENQKARVGIKESKENLSPADVLHHTWDTPAAIFDDQQNLRYYPYRYDDAQGVLSLQSLPLLTDASRAAGTPYFFDVSTSSATLPVDVRNGGLKFDLNLLLNKASLADTPFARRSTQDCPIVEQGGDVPTCGERSLPIGSWQNMHAYYHTWPDGSANAKGDFVAKLIGNINDAYTRMSGKLINAAADASTGFDNKTELEEGSDTAGYARTPVLLAFMNNFGLSCTKIGAMPSMGYDPSTLSESAQRYDLRVFFAPMVLWWNPYNVPMRIKGQQLWAKSLPHKTMWFEAHTKQGDSLDYSWGNHGFRSIDRDQLSLGGWGPDYGNYFQASLKDSKGDIVFQPGEILVFSPGQGDIGISDVGKFNNPFVLGYNPSNVSSNQVSIYPNLAGGSLTSGNYETSKSRVDAGYYKFSFRMGNGDVRSEPADYFYADTDGVRFGPNQKQAFTLLHGYGGMQEDIVDPESEERYLNGLNGVSPNLFLLSWYDPDDKSQARLLGSDGITDHYWQTDGSQANTEHPYFIASVGVTVKSANASLNFDFDTTDYRTKIWQYSSPAMGCGIIINATEQQKTYNAYQLSSVRVDTGFNAAPMSSVGHNGYFGINEEGEQVSFISSLELPIHPPFSLAGFAGMRLLPGWFKASGETTSEYTARHRRILYQRGVPSIGIGNSFADPTLPADDIYSTYRSQIPDFPEDTGNGEIFNDFFDHGLLINDALWDSYFCSSISDYPTANGIVRALSVVENFFRNNEPLAVSRYQQVCTPDSQDSIINRIMDEEGWRDIARYLIIEGGFNVNSTSVNAWTAVLQGLAKRQLVSNVEDGRLTLVEAGKSPTDVIFSRFMLSTTDKSLDSLGLFSPRRGSMNLRRDSYMTTAWGEVRRLDEVGIRQLAKQIVAQVRLRGPFLSMSDFINRRLDASNPQLSLKGALQSAIDQSGLNRDFDEVMISKAQSGQFFKFPEAAKGSLYTAAPGYLIQSDILSSLGNILTVRDDSFTIRAYGCVKNSRGAILAQAWCEASVQRCHEFVDPCNEPSARTRDLVSEEATELSPINKVLGRRLRVTSFKWLDFWDI